MRSILLHVDDDPCMEARLQVALDLAREFTAHLTCLQPVSFDFAVPGDLYGSMIAELIPVIQDNADKVRRRTSDRLANEDVAWDWQQEQGPARPLLMRAATLADVVILGSCDPASEGKGPSSLAGYMAIHSSTPLLVVPQSARSLDLRGAAAVGWNGSAEAGNALRGAVPLLRQASSVTLVNVAEVADTPGVSLPAFDAAEYLSRHGIRSEIVNVERGEQTIAQAIANAAAARKAQYLVIGAYGQTRAIETMFGGVTRELLSTPNVPVFTAH